MHGADDLHGRAISIGGAERDERPRVRRADNLYRLAIRIDSADGVH